MRLIRTIAVLAVFGLILAACGSGDTAPDEAPACVVNATALAEATSEGYTLRADEGGKIQRGIVAPDFALCDSNGNIVQLSDYEGEAVLLVFWTSWCGYCEQELLAINTHLDQFPDDLNVVLVGVPMNEETELSWNAHQERGYQMTALFDTAGTATQRYGIRAVPLSIFIDAEGVIVGQIYGEAHFENSKCLSQLEELAEGELSSVVTAYCRR